MTTLRTLYACDSGVMISHLYLSVSHPRPLQRRAQQTYQELSAKDRLLQVQNSAREDIQNRRSEAGKPAGGGGSGPLPEGWKEVKDPKTGATYYWNKVSAHHVHTNAHVFYATLYFSLLPQAKQK